MEENFLSSKEVLERIVRLETETKIRVETNDVALKLARDIEEKSRELENAKLDHRLEGFNRTKDIVTKFEGEFVKKRDLCGRHEIGI